MNAAELLLGSAALARHKERTALICGEERLSFADLARRVAQAGTALAALGVRPGQRGLLLMRDTPDFAAAWLGAVRAGAVAVALNNRLTETECRHVARDSAARLAVIDDAFSAARAQWCEELAADGRLVLARAWRR